MFTNKIIDCLFSIFSGIHVFIMELPHFAEGSPGLISRFYNLYLQ